MLSCTQCRKFLNSLDETYFIEETGNKGFCSDQCIEKFYSNYIEYFESIELNSREEFNLSDEESAKLCSNQEYIDSILTKPDQILIEEDELGDCIFQLSKKMKISNSKDLHCLIYCFIYKGSVSFILNVVTSLSQDFINVLKFEQEGTLDLIQQKFDHKIDNLEIDLTSHETEFLEQKKSQYLAKLIEKNNIDDIPFEKFLEYEEFINITLNDPDEVLHLQENNSDHIITFIKAQSKNNKVFYHFVICYSAKKDIILNKLKIILSFPTTNAEICSEFKIGNKISGNLIN